MTYIKALIIEPDATIRKMLSDLIRSEEGLAVADSAVGEYEDELKGHIGEVHPDVLLLGIDNVNSKEMQLFERVRKEHPGLPVIVMPRHDREGAHVALAALRNGAVEYITKTASRTGSTHTTDHFISRLIPVIKAVPRLNRHVLLSGEETATPLTKMEHVVFEHDDLSPKPVGLLVIVGCLGGVPALYRLLSSLPENLPVPSIIVQHMPKIYTEVLAEDLDRVTDLSVSEVTDGRDLEEGRVYIAPGGYHTIIKKNGNRHTLSLHRGPKIKGYRPSIDVLLESTRHVFGNRVLVVYLSGGGSDGIRGAEATDIAGGRIIIQNERTSLLWDLPWKVEGLGIDDGKYPLERLGYETVRRLI